MKRYLSVNVDEKNHTLTVGRILSRELGLTRKQISRAKFRPDGIQKNGIQCRVTDRAAVGDVIRVCLEEGGSGSEHLTAPETPSAFHRKVSCRNAAAACSDAENQPDSGTPLFSCPQTSVKPDILYEDLDLLIVNKPAGMVTHPSGVHYSDSLANLVMEYYRQRDEHLRVRPIGRLDRETSGIVVLAKNQVAAARLQAQRQSGGFCKEYLAVVHGTLPADGDDCYLLRHVGSSPIYMEGTPHASACANVLGTGKTIHAVDFPIAPDLKKAPCTISFPSVSNLEKILHSVNYPSVPDSEGTPHATNFFNPLGSEKSIHTIDFPIEPDPKNPLKMLAVTCDPSKETPQSQTDNSRSAQQSTARPAVTHYRTLYTAPDWSLVLLHLDTGRTHQIRVHMKAIRHPLLGDTLYSADRPVPPPFTFTRTALHAWRRSSSANHSPTNQSP